MKPFFYIHIPKTAGVSIEHMLKPHCKDFQHPMRTKISIEDSLFFGHNDPDETSRYITAEHYKNAIIAAFMRDPRARLVSLYYHLRAFASYSFPDFVRRVTKAPIPPIGMYAKRGLSPCNPQARWLENSRIDFLGKFENLDKDWYSLSELIGIQYHPLPHLNKRENKIGWKNYFVDSPHLLEMANNFYKEDLEIGGYPEQIRFD